MFLLDGRPHYVRRRHMACTQSHARILIVIWLGNSYAGQMMLIRSKGRIAEFIVNDEAIQNSVRWNWWAIDQNSQLISIRKSSASAR